MKQKTFFLGIIFGIILLFLAVINTDLNTILFLLSKTNPLLIILGLFPLALGLFLKTWRWQILLESALPKTRIFAILSIGYLVNNLLPARLGEAARIYLVGRREKVGIMKTLATIIMEKALDTLVLILILLALLLGSPILANNLKILFLGITLPQEWQTRITLFFSSFKLLKDKRRVLALFVLSLLIWLAEAFWNYSLISSLKLNVPLSAAFFLAAVVNLGLFLPSPPGYIGVFHFLATFALLPFGVDKSQALSYALLQHTLEYFILSALGCWSAFKLSFNPLEEKKWKNP